MNLLHAWRVSCRGRWAATYLMGPAIWIAMLLWTSPVGALVPGSATADLSVVPPLSVASSSLDPADLENARLPLEDFSRETSSRWAVLNWAPVSLTPRLAVGTGLDLGSAIPDGETAERAARELVAGRPALFGTSVDRLGEVRIRHGLGKWSVAWRETVHGMPVLHSRVATLLTDDGRLAAFGAVTFPEIQDAAVPVVETGSAREIARRHLDGSGLLPRAAILDRDEVEGPYVLPVRTVGEIGTRAVSGRTIWRVALASMDPPASYEVDVDALSGEVLQRTDVLRHLTDLVGTASGWIEVPNWCAGFTDQPVANMLVRIVGADSTYTGPDGGFVIPHGGTEPLQITAELRGACVDVNNVVGDDALFTGVITPGVPFALYWDDAASRADERCTYFHVNAFHDLLKSIDPDWTDMDFPLPANVNLQQGCNAFWNGESINMFHEQGNCANTGQIGDVIVHEYAHGITDFMYGPDDPPSDMHEGNSDVAGNYATNEHIVGPGFYLDDCEAGIRDSDNDLHWPDDLQGEGHYDGRILAGFHWHAREALIAELGYETGAELALTLWHYARVMGLPSEQPEQVWWTFLMDDDDGNLDNGTPHYAALSYAAARHTFPYPEAFDNVVIHHTPLLWGSSPDDAPIRIEAEIYSFDHAMNPDSVLAYERAAGGGDFSSQPFQPVTGDTWEAFLTGRPVGAQVDYYIVAVDEAGNRLRRPEDGWYTFTTAYAADDFEVEGDWTVGAPGDDATTGIWERVDPIGETFGLPLQPPDDATPDPGRFCYITGQYTGGAPEGSDADGRTTLLSPVYDLTGMTWATVSYNRWFQTLNTFEGILQISVSYDGGNFWTLLEQVQGLQLEPAWEYMEHDITPPFGQLGLVRFRVVMRGRPFPCLDEAGFDDFVLLADDQGGPVGVPEDEGGGRLSLSLRGIHPATGGMTLDYHLPADGWVTLRLYAVDGSEVGTLVRGALTAGTHEVHWDGRDTFGRRVPSGIYFAKLHGPGGAETRRIVLMR